MMFFKDLITGIDGTTFDPARVLWILGVLCFLCFTGFEVYTKQSFDMVNFGIAYGALLAAGASGVRIKQDSEPGAKT